MKFLLPLLLILSINCNAQVWHIKRSVKWTNPPVSGIGVKNFVSFPGGNLASNSATFPDYYEIIPWHSEYPSVKVSLVMTEYEDFTGNLTSVQIEELTGKKEINAGIAYESLKPFLQLTLCPFRINTTTKNLQRLKSFVILIEADPVNKAQLQEKSSLKKSFQNSVFSSGNWYKIRVSSTGIFKITYDQLKSLGLDDPSRVRIFGNGGNMLPEDYRKGNKDTLLPTQLHFVKGTDNVFNQGDYLLFYAVGPVSWSYDNTWGMFRQKRNFYSDFGYYFVTSDAGGPDIPSIYVNPAEPANYSTSSYDSYTYHEIDGKSFKNNVNGMRTGKEWFGEDFTYNTEQSFTLDLPELIKTDPVIILAAAVARSKDSSAFYMSYKNLNIDTLKIRSANLSDYTEVTAFTKTGKTLLNVTDNSFDLKFSFLKREPAAMGWLDYVTVNGRSELKLNSGFLLFRDSRTVAPDRISSFTVNSVDNKVYIWDVTDPNNVLKLTSTLTGSQLNFRSQTDTLKEFVAFKEDGNFLSPQLSGNELGIINNQDLHGIGNPDLVIVSYKDFIPASDRIANFRRENDNLEVAVVTPEQIFNEFSSGTPDISAIRNFMKFLYDKADGDPNSLPRFLLLMGDGSYDNKGIDPNSTNYILTYQSDNSTSPISSYVSDDFYALLDPGEALYDGMLDIGVGRIPVKTVEEAEYMADKIINYSKPDRMGDWRNSICFIGDDEDGNIHMAQADQLADYVTNNYPDTNVGKIFLDAYQQVSSSTGQKYPDVNTAISRQIDRGALIINYTGHGGNKGLAHEQIITIPDIKNWQNSTRLPIFMTATCEFSRYDEHEFVSAGEEVLLNQNGGAIALFSTTRLVYSAPNHTLNEKFYEVVFKKDINNQHHRLGDIIKLSKNLTGNGINKRNFSLLGDPSMKLAYPDESVVTDSVNGINISITTDTLRALNKVKISGHLVNSDGSTRDNFNGMIYPTVYDKAMIQSTLANDGGSKRNFTLRNNILYKGKASVNSGKFDFTFIVPKDIAYAFGKGKLSYYATDSLIDITGSFQNLVIGGSEQVVLADGKGPEVDVYINNPWFKSGGITDENPVLFVKVFDENGINTTGNGIGHDITASLNVSTQKNQVLNEFYEADLDNYQSGTIKYPLSDLNEGLHTVNIKVWDVYNNSNVGYTEFYVIKDKNLNLDGLMNFPNPFTESTSFSFEHNRPGNTLDITIDIFNLTGELVKTIKAKDDGSGYRTQPIYWDGRAESGNFNRQGLYLYRIRVTSSDGKSTEKSGKLIITR